MIILVFLILFTSPAYANDCCTSSSSPGCDNDNCMQMVCGVEPRCCTEAWDQNCPTIANGLCTQYPNCRCDCAPTLTPTNTKTQTPTITPTATRTRAFTATRVPTVTPTT